MENIKTPKPLNIGQFAIAFGLVYLATALVFVGFEAASLRKQIPAVLSGLEDLETASETHPLLTRIDKALVELPRMTREVEAIREQVPVILEESVAIRALVPEVLAEIREVRAAMVPLLAESAALRADLPVIIEEAGVLVDDAKGVSKQVGAGAAQGAVEGTVKGIIGAPFEVLKQGADLITPDSKKDEPVEADAEPSQDGKGG